MLSKIDEKKQKKEYDNISTFGNIEELGRIASDTASLLTLYYKEQIELIDTASKIKGSNFLNDKIKWIKDALIDVRPEEKEEMPVVIVAEYITAWIIEILRQGKKHLNVIEPLPQQLWFCIAKKDFVDQGKGTAVTDSLGGTAGRQRIPLKIQRENSKEATIHVQLRYLIGCVSLVTNDGKIYQYPISRESAKEDLEDLELFGYVYITPFLNDEKLPQEIIDGRKLILAPRDADNNILTKLKDIEQYVQTFQTQGDHTRESAITAETARQVAKVLRVEKSFVDPNDLKSTLDKSRQEIEISIDVLREDIQKKTDHYQASIEATNERLQNTISDALESLKRDNEKHYSNALQKLNEQLKRIEKNLENQVTERMNTIESQMKSECDTMRKIVETAKANSDQALKQTNEAAEASKRSAQHAEQAREDAKKLVESTEQRRQELQAVMDRCEASVKQTIAEQKQFCEQTISAVRTKVQQDFERTKASAEQASANAKESAEAAKGSAKAAQETQNDTRKQLDLQKDVTKRTISDAHEATRNSKQSADEAVRDSKRSANEASDANKRAGQAGDASTEARKRVDDMQKKFETALERLEKLSKKLETK